MTMQTKTLKAVGRNTMHCGGCESTVKFSLRQLPGIEKVEANYKTQRIRLAFDPQAVTLERVRQALDEIGYQVEEVVDA